MFHFAKNICGTGNRVVLDSCFYILQVLVGIKNGVCGINIIKNRWYWLRYINFDKIKGNFTNN